MTLKEWFKAQANSFRYQITAGRRDSVVSTELEHQRSSLRNVSHVEEPDPVLDELCRERSELTVKVELGNSPTVERVKDLTNEMAQMTRGSDGDYVERGRGIGGFFGKLLSGRIARNQDQLQNELIEFRANTSVREEHLQQKRDEAKARRSFLDQQDIEANAQRVDQAYQTLSPQEKAFVDQCRKNFEDYPVIANGSGMLDRKAAQLGLTPPTDSNFKRFADAITLYADSEQEREQIARDFCRTPEEIAANTRKPETEKLDAYAQKYVSMMKAADVSKVDVSTPQGRVDAMGSLHVFQGYQCLTDVYTHLSPQVFTDMFPNKQEFMDFSQKCTYGMNTRQGIEGHVLQYMLNDPRPVQKADIAEYSATRANKLSSSLGPNINTYEQFVNDPNSKSSHYRPVVDARYDKLAPAAQPEPVTFEELQPATQSPRAHTNQQQAPTAERQAPTAPRHAPTTPQHAPSAPAPRR